MMIMGTCVVQVSEGAQKRREKANVSKASAEQILIQQGKEAVKNSLKDPESAQFRNVHVAVNGEKVVRGEVNSKNSYGGYDGFEKFYWGRFKNVNNELVGEKYVSYPSNFVIIHHEANKRLSESERSIESSEQFAQEYREKFIEGW